MRASVIDLEVYLPDRRMTNADLEERITLEGSPLPSGTLDKLCGPIERRYAESDVQVSDLACLAASRLMERNKNAPVDLIIFAAASSDLIEPATACIIQQKLNLSCPAFDLKNACNSVVSAMQTASAFVECGMYRHVLIVTGEKLSEVIRWHCQDANQFKRSLVGYSLGDAGTAMLMGLGTYRELLHQRMQTWGTHWPLCAVRGGGSMAFRDPDAYFFEGNPIELKAVFAEKTGEFVQKNLSDLHLSAHAVDWLITHQVSENTSLQLAGILGVDSSKAIPIFSEYGNLAAATIPVALHRLMKSGNLKRGQLILVIGMAAGISLSVQLIKA